MYPLQLTIENNNVGHFSIVTIGIILNVPECVFFQSNRFSRTSMMKNNEMHTNGEI